MFDFLKRKASRANSARRGETIDLSPPGVSENARFHRTHFIDCTLHHSEDWTFYLTQCRFTRCTLRLRGSNRYRLFDGCHFENTVFKLSHGASGLWFQDGQTLTHCRFEGTLRDGRFDGGGRCEMIEALDMRGLKFDMIAFRGGANPDEVMLPPWPSFAMRETLPKRDARLAMLPEEIRTLIATPQPGERFAFNLERMKAGEEEMWPALRRADWVRVDV